MANKISRIELNGNDMEENFTNILTGEEEKRPTYLQNVRDKIKTLETELNRVYDECDNLYTQNEHLKETNMDLFMRVTPHIENNNVENNNITDNNTIPQTSDSDITIEDVLTKLM